jgi:hypothetical protein
MNLIFSLLFHLNTRSLPKIIPGACSKLKLNVFIRLKQINAIMIYASYGVIGGPPEPTVN